jgi:hypothetical protein
MTAAQIEAQKAGDGNQRGGVDGMARVRDRSSTRVFCWGTLEALGEADGIKVLRRLFMEESGRVDQRLTRKLYRALVMPTSTQVASQAEIQEWQLQNEPRRAVTNASL